MPPFQSCPPPPRRKGSAVAGAALLTLALSACGGGGGGAGGAEQGRPPPTTTRMPDRGPGGAEPSPTDPDPAPDPAPGPGGGAQPSTPAPDAGDGSGDNAGNGMRQPPPAPPPPAAPTDVRVLSGRGGLTVTWSEVMGASRYRVQWKSGDETYESSREAVIEERYGVSGIDYGYFHEPLVGQDDREFTFRVFAVPADGGAPQPSADASGALAKRLAGISVQAVVDGLQVSWSPAPGAGRYWVQWKSGSERYSLSRRAFVTGTSHTISGLTPNRPYTVRVVNEATGGENLPSSDAAGTPTSPNAAAAPAGVAAEAVANGLRVSWSAARNAASYKVQWKSGSEAYGSSREADVTAGTSHTITGLEAFKRYQVRVLTVPTDPGDNLPSGDVEGRPTYAVPAGAPAGVGATAAVQALNVSWTAAAGAASYKVQWRTGEQAYDDDDREVSVTGTSHTITGLVAGRPYSFRVVAVPSGGAELPSAERAVIPTPPSHAAVATVRAWTSPPSGSRYPAETLQPSNPGSKDSWLNEEYSTGHHLEHINAAAGYAARDITMGEPGGGGRTIAIVDDTLDVDTATNTGHPDLQGAISLNGHSAGIAHGTRVAGVAAARRNGVGMHGVAFNANIVGFTQAGGGGEIGAILASAAGRPQEVGGRTADDSPAGSSHIVNLSLNVTSHAESFTKGMKILAAAGRIIVGGTGNRGRSEPEGLQASLAADDGIAGNAIAVGATSNLGRRRALFSSACGAVKRYCMFAVGNEVRTTDGRYGFSTPSGYATVAGTSYAAPMVAGAAAAVWAAFPNKNGAQVVERLLTTARQIDAANGDYDPITGLSDIYGHGMLDLGAAMNPVGFTSSVLPGGRLVPTRQSFVDLPPGLRLRPSSALAGSVVYDTQGFPFLHDLNPAFRERRERRDATHAMEEFLASLGGARTEARLGEDIAVEFAATAEDPHRDLRDEDGELGAYRLRARTAPGLWLTLGRGFGAAGASGDFVARRLARTPLHDGFAAGPFAALAGSGAELGAVWDLDPRTRLDFAGKDSSGYFGGGRARLASFGAARRVGDALTLGARFGLLRERGSLLGARGGGAFGGFADAATDFLELSAERRFGNLTLFGGASRGWTRAAAGGAGTLVAGWSGLRGEAFAFGGEWLDLWRRSDRLTLAASSPFRARGAALQVDVPDREPADGVVAYTRHRVSLTPRGRELRLQLAYEAEAAPGAALAVGGYLRLEPEHDPAASAEFGAAAKLRLAF